MSEVKLDPTVIQFKKFINNKPVLIKRVREEGRSWQEYYEKWALLGEDDPMWEKYKQEINEKEHRKQELLSGLVTLINYVDLNTIDKYINQFSNVILFLGEFLNNYKGDTESSSESTEQANASSWIRD